MVVRIRSSDRDRVILPSTSSPIVRHLVPIVGSNSILHYSLQLIGVTGSPLSFMAVRIRSSDRDHTCHRRRDTAHHQLLNPVVKFNPSPFRTSFADSSSSSVVSIIRLIRPSSLASQPGRAATSHRKFSFTNPPPFCFCYPSSVM